MYAVLCVPNFWKVISSSGWLAYFIMQVYNTIVLYTQKFSPMPVIGENFPREILFSENHPLLPAEGAGCWQNLCPNTKHEPLAKFLSYTVHVHVHAKTDINTMGGTGAHMAKTLKLILDLFVALCTCTRGKVIGFVCRLHKYRQISRPQHLG